MPDDLFTAAGTAPPPRPDDPVAQVVVVCHANICRSPLGMAMLEAQVRKRLGDDAPVWVRSAGVHAIAGHPAAEHTLVQASARGLDLHAHRANQLARSDIADADLVVTMTERQRTRAVRQVPAASRWTFTLPELARLCVALEPVDTPGRDPRDRIRSLVRLAGGSRSYVARPAEPEDVPDPYGGPADGYEAMAVEIASHVEVIAPHLFGWLPGERS